MDGAAIFRKFGLDLVGVMRTSFGTGVTSKTSAVKVWSVLGFAFIAVWMPDSSYKPWVLLGYGLWIAYWMTGTWIHTTVNPAHALEGQNTVEFWRNSQAAKGLPNIPVTAIIENPEYKDPDTDEANS